MVVVVVVADKNRRLMNQTAPLRRHIDLDSRIPCEIEICRAHCGPGVVLCRVGDVDGSLGYQSGQHGTGTML